MLGLVGALSTLCMTLRGVEWEIPLWWIGPESLPLPRVLEHAVTSS
jgi:hypothetical protein